MSDPREFRERSAPFDRIVDRRGTDSIKWSYYEPDVLPMWVADMDFPAPPAMIEALEDRVRHGIFGYAAEPPELRELFVERLRRIYGWSVGPEALVFLPNVAVAFNLTCQAVTSPGDEVSYHTPIYFPILRVPGNAGLEATPNLLCADASGRYEVDLDAFEQAITDRTRVYILCNPHNPVARVFRREELERLAEICVRHEMIICSDEIHADFVYDDRPHVPIASLDPEIARRSVTLFAPNKSYNVAGVSSAIAVAPDEGIRRRLIDAKRGLVPHVGALSYTAAVAAYRNGDPWLSDLVAYLQENRDTLMRFVAEEIPEVKIGPVEGTYLAWLDCRSAIDENPHEYLLREARVALNDGASFGPGGEGFVRLNFACPRTRLLDGLGQMRDALRKL